VESRSAAGVNLIADIFGDSGLCEAARNTLDAIRACDIGFSHVDLSYGDRRAEHVDDRFRDLPGGLAHPVNLLFYNINMFPLLGRTQLVKLMQGKYTAAYWTWELPRLPDTLVAQFESIDEVWVPSHFVQNAMALATSKRVCVVPHPVHVRVPQAVHRAQFGLPDRGYIFLFAFSAPSTFGRKNPWAVIDAFEKAFGSARHGGPLLVIKAHHADLFPDGRDALRKAIARVGGILLEESYSREQMNALLACADAFVSLHRAEGFGLGLAESMYLGKPVIATQFSGNVDFMNHTNSYPVRYHLRPIVGEDHRYQPRDAALYEPGQLWAEPDVEQAAAYMRYLYEHPEAGQEQGAHAAAYVRQHLSLDAVGRIIRERLQQIDPAVRPASDTPFFRIGKRPIRALSFAFDRFVPGSGWGGPECALDGDAPRWFQWTVDPEATFDVCLAEDGDYVVELRVLHALLPEILDSLTLAANEHRIHLTRRRDESGMWLFKGVIPRTAVAGNPRGTRLVFRVNRTVRPREAGADSDDWRSLGVAVHSLRLTSVRPSDPVLLHFDQPVDGTGWHAPEVGGDGTTFAWMAGQSATVCIELVPGNDYAVECSVLEPPVPGILDTLALSVNGHEVALTSRHERTHGYLFQGNIPAVCLAGVNGLVCLMFTVGRTFCPHAHDSANGDERTLGLAFDWLRIVPARRRRWMAR
jgi:glycosyltransferase involved in cell wall biosynthesis